MKRSHFKLKLLLLLLGKFGGKIWLLFIPTSGHIDRDFAKVDLQKFIHFKGEWDEDKELGEDRVKGGRQRDDQRRAERERPLR